MSSPPPVVVIAPDSLKGSCTSPQAAAALAEGARAALGDGARVIEVPLADGGEGTLDALAAAWGGRILGVRTGDALGRDRSGRIGISPDGRTAIVEAAEANGLPHVSDRRLRPLDADTAGVGTLLRAALEAGAEEILLCVGGSATNDGGAGMLRALGARLLDAEGSPIAAGARGLGGLASLDLSGLLPAARAARWRIACDVEHPLTGPNGAAAVFGPQKGAAPADIRAIDAGLERLSGLLAAQLGVDPASLARRPGTGAAGGLAIGPVALFEAELVPGATLVAEAAGLGDALADADLVITGEGRLDAQSLSGKVVSRVVEEASPRVPVVVIAGSVALSAAECRSAGITAALSVAPGPASLDELRAQTPRLLAEAAAHACALARLPLRG
ncbi:glycerate kinase [Leucobacter sp. wl10]|uniref:glycerate kinase n=1 Tax=Leucobacter sp. wl10 TaxID=2304677 RepID=UPI000E5B12C9|nr:glycerate kinase [Leucobacter sp. wl10]RGE19209.1 glycerate kinase [Leucobacter sp. wl10]